MKTSLKRSERGDPAANTAFKFLREIPVKNLGWVSHPNMINTREHFLEYFFDVRNILKCDVTIFKLSGINLFVDDFLYDFVNCILIMYR